MICSEQIFSAPTEVGSAVSKSACECLTAAARRWVPAALCFAANVCDRLEALAELLAEVVTALQKPFVYLISGLRKWQTCRLQDTRAVSEYILCVATISRVAFSCESQL